MQAGRRRLTAGATRERPRAMVRLAAFGAVLTVAGTLYGCGGGDGGALYVTSGLTDEVVRLDASDGSIVRRIATDRQRHETDEPHAVAVAPDGRHWYVTVAHGQPSLWKFEVDDDRLVGRVDLPSGGAAMIGLSADGSTAYVPDYDRAGGRVGRVAAVRLRDLTVTAHAPVCGAPHDAALRAAGDVVAVACSGSDEIVFLDAHDLSVLRRIVAPSPAAHLDTSQAGAHASPGGGRPLSVAWSPDGELLAVALHAAAAVWLVDAEGRTRGVVSVGAGPAQVVFADGGTLVSANRMGGSLSVIDVDALAEVRRVRLDGPYPHGVALDESGRTAYVAYEGTAEAAGGVIAVDIVSGDILWRTEAGRYVLGIAYLAR